jgi:hypothetical protein
MGKRIVPQRLIRANEIKSIETNRSGNRPSYQRLHRPSNFVAARLNVTENRP